MTTIESDFEKLNMSDQSAKGKQNMLSCKSNKMETDGNIDHCGEDTTDSCPSKPAPVPDICMPGHPSKEMVRTVPTPRNVLPKTDDQQCLEMNKSEDSVDAVPTNKPTARVSAVLQPNAPVQQRSSMQETGAAAASASGAVPGTRPQITESQGAKQNTAQHLSDLEGEKDVILYELAEQVAGSCDLRKLALRLRIMENEVALIEHDNPKLFLQFYKVFQNFSLRVSNSGELFKQLLEVLTKADQRSAAAWLRNRIGQKEPEASLHESESSPVSDIIPQTETRGGNVNSEFHDIFLFHTGESKGTEKFRSMCQRHGWTLKASDTIPAATPVHAAIEKILNTSTHLALIITESDCINYKKREMCMTVEMALQMAYNHDTLSGKVLPIRCCDKRSLPLVLQALTGAHIDDESFENRIKATIDTKTRVNRMREMQD